MKYGALIELMSKVRNETVDAIIAEADEFTCCPRCGATDIENDHYCQHCKERMVEPDSAWWFGQYLRRKYGVK